MNLLHEQVLTSQGIISVIKTAMMLERGFILPNYDFKKPNEKIPFSKWHLKVSYEFLLKIKEECLKSDISTGACKSTPVAETKAFCKR